MTQWKYEADGGSYTVEEGALRSVVAEGKLDGETRLTRVDDDSLHRVDTAFPKEYRAAQADRAKRDAERHASEKQKRSYAGPAMIVMLVLAGAAFYAFNWYNSRITCSREDVTKLVQRIIKEKLLKVDKGNIIIYSIATIGALDSGGVKCSADADIKDSGSLFDGLHEIEYSAERQGDNIYVTSRLTR